MTQRSIGSFTARVAALLVLTANLTAYAATAPDFVVAARQGDGPRAMTLAAQAADVNAAEADGTTALHWAARFNDLELASMLLDAGADPSLRNRYGVTPLYLAALNGSAAMIEQLLEAGADANEVGNEGETVLMTVAQTGVVAAADVLLAHGAQVEARELWHGQTALMWAAAEGHPAMVARLIEAGADVNAISDTREWERQRSDEPRDKWLPPGGFSALLYAAREGCADCVPVLAEAGANLDQTTAEDISGVVLALINGHYDTAIALLDAGTDPNLYDYTGRGAIYAAADFNTMPMSNRPAPNVLPNEHSALDVMRHALELGADPNAQLTRQAPYRAKLDRGNDTVLTTGTTALVRAAKSADVPAVELLLEFGADASLATRGGVNALMIAAGLGNAEQDTTGRFKNEADIIRTIDILIGEGLDINATDNRGRTALHGAALHGFDEVIRALVERGGDLSIADRDGITAHDTAMGLAGGFGFTGGEGRVREQTAALIEELLENAQ